MYKEHPVFEKPENEDVKIWRFIDFQKYVSLLDIGALYFNRTDRFDDILEGTYSKAVFNAVQNQITDQSLKKAIIEGLTFTEKYFVKGTYLNCWHINDFESDAMWKLYTGKNGVAIQSTFNRLTKSFIDNREIYIGKVRYVDYATHLIGLDKKMWNSFDPFVHKRLSFQHEQELRVVTTQYPENWNSNPSLFDNNPNGLYVKVDLEELIENIYVVPRAPSWFKDLAISVSEKYGLKKPIESSSLDERPLFR